MTNRVHELLTAYLDGMSKRGELLPGGKETILKSYTARRWAGPTQALAALIADFEASPAAVSPLRFDANRPGAGPARWASRYLNPEYQPAEAEAPLRAALRRLEAGGLLGDGKADAAYGRLAADLVGLSGTGLASVVADRVYRRESEDLLRVQPELVGAAAEIQRVLQAFAARGHLGGLDTRKLAQDWESDMARNGIAGIARAVAARLSSPVYAALTKDGQPLQIDPLDPILRSGSEAAPRPENVAPPRV